jgi:Macrocin-O-methyltransferase (TylF)
MRSEHEAESVKTGDANAADRGRHPLKEVLHRARDPEWVADTALRLVVRTWDLVSPSEFSSLYRRIRTRTMCSNARLRGLYRGVIHVTRNDVPGDFVECGSALGGSAALIALTLRQLGLSRPLWLFDTFEGLPAPTSDDPDFEIANLFTGSCLGTLDEVQSLFEQLQIREQVQFIKGLFQETLPAAALSQIALLHIDGDWYESVRACLDNLYDKVAPGGIIQFDDYGYWKGARKAVDEFLDARGVRAPLKKLDYSGRFLVKPLSSDEPENEAALQKPNSRAGHKVLNE